jgi:hypothetical protein
MRTQSSFFERAQSVLSELKICFFVFTIIYVLLFVADAKAQTKSSGFFNFFSTEEKIPNEFYIARVPGLGPVYGARASWFFYRPPFVWAQSQLYDFRKLNLPQWDKDQVPLVISPTSGPAQMSIVLENSDGSVIEEIPLKSPFVPDRYAKEQLEKSKPVPENYRLQAVLLNGRLKITTRPYRWVQRKQIFECEAEIEQEKDALQDGRVKTCLSTLDSIAQTAEQQWYVVINWPETGNVLKRNAISARDRELRSGYRKAGHVYETQRKGKKFTVSAGVTSVETVPVHEFDYMSILKTQQIMMSPPRDEETKIIFETRTKNDERLVVSGFAADAVEQSEVKSPAGLIPAINLQFVAGTGDTPYLEDTEFMQNRIGFTGFFRRWRGQSFFSQNYLTSSRGEESEVLAGPGFELAYASDYWNLEPFVVYDTGFYHPQSVLSVSEFQAGVGKNFEFMPTWSYFYSSFHQYQLSGRNPGSSRLGATDSISLGIGGLHRIGKHYLQGRAALLFSTAAGFDSRFEYGQVWHRKTDFHLTWGVFFGLSRYGGPVKIVTNSTTQTLTENRFVLGVSIGFLGPENKTGSEKLKSP